MNKILTRSVITILISVSFMSAAFSQEFALNTKKKEKALAPESKNQSSEIRYANDVNGRVLRSFRQSFGEKSDAQWSRTEKGFVVCFKEKDITTNVYFMNNGTIDYRVHYYSEAQLPGNVRHTVKSNFYDYSIIQVSEVHKDESVNYFIKAEDKVSVKTIRVIGDECKVVETLIKQ